MTLLLAWHFDEASGATVLDRSGLGRDLTISGIGVRTASGNGHTDRGLTATGGGQLVGPSLSGLQTANRTIMGWVKNTSAVLGHVIELYVPPTVDSSAWSILFLSGQVHIQARSASTLARASATWTPSATWHHIAGTYDGTNVRLYIDGVLAATTALTGPLRTDATDFRVLDNSDSSTTIDDVRLYDVALSQAQIAADAATPVADSAVNSGSLAGSFSSTTASFTGAAVPSDPGALIGTFSTPTASLAANGIVRGLLTGSFTSLTAAISGSATAEVTVDGTFAAPTTAFAAQGSATAELSGAFSNPTFSLQGGSVGLNAGELNAQFSAPIVTIVGTAAASALLAGTFSSPAFSATGGEPQVDRDILVTIGPGTRPGTSIEVGPARTVVAQGAIQRSQIGAGHMNGTWRKGSKEYVDFVVFLKDPDNEMTLSDVQAIPFWVLVKTGADTPTRADAGWVSKDPEVTAVDDTFAVELLHLYEAVGTGFHTVWVKFGPTPEEPIYQAATFVVL